MKKRLLTVTFLMGVWGAYAQVGIGTTTPNKSSQLEIVAKDKGILIPQVPLKSITDTATIANGNVTSLLVWNTSTLAGLTPGYYYWNKDKWMRIVDTDTFASLDANTKNASLTVVGDKLVLTDTEGGEVDILLTAINLPTTLSSNPDGTYVYTNEAGVATTINVPEDVINNFYDIVNNTDVLQELITVLGDTYVGGNVYYNGTKFTYVTVDGEVKEITFKEIVKANETVTKLVTNANGTYTYYNEVAIDAAGNPIAGTGVTIDIPASVIQNFEDIINNTDVKNELFQAIHNSYVGGNVYYNGTKFTYVTVDGEVKEITFKEIVKANETVTKLVTNANGTYTYYNEVAIDAAGNPIAGTGVTIDIPASVIQNFEDIINNTDVKNELFQTIHNSYVGGNVYYNGTKFTYVTVDGEVKEITFKEIVKANETVTKLVTNANGTYTYYNEVAIDAAGNPIAGTGVTIDIPASVIQNFEDIINNTDVKNELFQTIHNSYVGGNVYYNGTKFTYVTVDGEVKEITFKEIVKANETITHLVANANGTFTYYNEGDYAADGSLKADAVGVTIDPSLVNVTKVGNKYVFENNKGDVIVELEYNAGDIVYNDSTTNLGVTNVQDAIEKLLTKIVTVENTKGDLTVDGSITLDDGVDVLLKNASIKVAEKGIQTTHINTKAVTAEKLDAGTGVVDRVGVADASGVVTYKPLSDLLEDNQQTVVLLEGTNTTVESAVDATNAKQTNWKVNVATAKGATDTSAATLGLVKEATANPTVLVSQTGELSVNLTTVNAIKEVADDYTALLTDVILLGNANAGDVTITLPAAVAANKGKKFTIKKQDGNEDFYVHVSGSINGLTELYTALPHSGWDLVSDGTTWKIVNKF